MALTEQARKALNAKIEGHGVQAGVVLPSGLTKVSGGLIARPSTDRSGTRTGILAEEAAEQAAGNTEQQSIQEEPASRCWNRCRRCSPGSGCAVPGRQE